MPNKNQPGCTCCFDCEQLTEFLSTQPGTIDGYTPFANWSGSNEGCCWFRQYNLEHPNTQYSCEDCSSDSYFGGCSRYGTQFEITRGEIVRVWISRYKYGDGAFPDCDPDNNPETAFQGAKYVFRSTYFDRAELKVVIYSKYLDPFCTPPTFNCPQQSVFEPPFFTGPSVSSCAIATVLWHRISEPFVNLPSSVTFNTQSVTTCYCNPIDGPNPGCLSPCQAGPLVYDVEPQCVQFFGGSASCAGIWNPIFGPCRGRSYQHCFTPPTWTISF